MKTICESCDEIIDSKTQKLVTVNGFTYHDFCAESNVMSYNVGHSNYSKNKIQPWDIWEAYKGIDPWRLDIVKRALREKESDDPVLDLEKIKHVCDKLIDLYENSDYFIKDGK